MSFRACLLRQLAACLTGLLLAGAAHAQAELQRLKFTADWILTGAHAPFVLAVDGGHLRRHGLDVDLQRGAGSAEAVRRVASGEFDVGLADLGAIVQHNARDPANAVTAFYIVHDRSTLAVLSLAERQIRAPADLEGKVLGAPEGEAGRLLFPLFAAVNGIDHAQVRWQSVEPALRETLLISGSVDAITGHASSALLLELQGVRRDRIRVLRFSDYGVELYGTALFARADALRRQPRAFAAFARGINEGLLHAIGQPALALDALKRRLGQRAFPEVEALRLRAALDDAVLTPAVRRHGLSQVDPARLAQQVEQVSRALRLPRVPALASVYTDALLPPREERQVARATLTGALALCGDPPPAVAAAGCR